MSSGITLSAASRQNLLSLQDTASLLSTTQNRLSTGKKVNSALDNPVSFFTAQSLDSRSNSLNSLLDSISNGIQTIQAANKGITSLQSLTGQLTSTARQALSSSNAFSSKAQFVSSAITNATGQNLLGTNATTGTAVGNATATAQTVTAGAAYGSAGAAETLTFTGSGANVTVSLAAGDTIDQAIQKINAKSGDTGVTASKDGAGTSLVFTGKSDGSAFSVVSSAAAGATTSGVGNAALPGAGGSFRPAGSSIATNLGFTAGNTFTVNSQIVTVAATDTIDSLAGKIATATGGDVKANFDPSTRMFTMTAKDGSTNITLADGTAGSIAKLGLTAGTTSSSLNNKTISVKVGNGTTPATTITFGGATGQVKTLDDLNAALNSQGAQASIDSNGKLTITTLNESGSNDLTIGGTATGTNQPFVTAGTTKAVIGGDGKTARDKLVNDFNNLLQQIDQTALDSGFNGVNLLSGDNLKVVFNEKNSSSLNVRGYSTSSASLGLTQIASADFVDAASIAKVLLTVDGATSTLKSQASTFGSNLSVIQNRQDFTKNMVNILDTGSANLVNADMNEEAANSQALSTRNSLGISALSLANQAQQGILQLLR